MTEDAALKIGTALVEPGLPCNDSWQNKRTASATFDAAIPYIFATVIFCCSRGVIAAAIAFAVMFLPSETGVSTTVLHWSDYLLRWDAEWYRTIATHGYSFNGDRTQNQNIVFYPLYPLLSRYLAAISGLDIGLAMLLVANASALVGILLIFRLSRQHFSTETSLTAVTLISFFPGSLFLSAGYTEATL